MKSARDMDVHSQHEAAKKGGVGRSSCLGFCVLSLSGDAEQQLVSANEHRAAISNQERKVPIMQTTILLLSSLKSKSI